MDAPAVERRARRSVAKGRLVDEDALTEIVGLIGEDTPPRDRLIECLHVLQDTFGHISARHLRALAEHMRLSQAEVYEVATFYHHFDVVKEGGAVPPSITVRVCDSVACSLVGAEQLAAALEAAAIPDVRIVRVPCIGRCDTAPAARVRDRDIDHATAETIKAMVAARDFAPLAPDYIGLDAYREGGGYRTLEALRTGKISFDEMVETLDEAGLRGLGGAGFPLATKWRIV
ncbi:MAG: NAD(P)H-dependent oxidoreductase subunit E, partial [Pseudomonadota bacterium]